MTIQFNCPNCGELIAFDSKHIGKRARCLSCGQLFIIPAKDSEKPEKVEFEPAPVEPVPGFYRVVFIDSWKLFIDKENVRTLCFIAAVVCFKFFLAEACCFNYITYIVTWGWLFGLYLNIIYETAYGSDKLPEVYLGSGVEFLWNIIKPILTFFFTLFMVWLPFILSLSLLQDRGIDYGNMWQLEFGPRLLPQIFFLIGLFLFPMAILTTAVGRDITLFRPDYLIRPIRKALIPYLVPFGLLVLFALSETMTKQASTERGLGTTVFDLGLNLAVQAIAVIAMRSIGLFYRHYNCYSAW